MRVIVRAIDHPVHNALERRVIAIVRPDRQRRKLEAGHHPRANDVATGSFDVALDRRMTERSEDRSPVEQWIGEVASIRPPGSVRRGGEHDYTVSNCRQTLQGLGLVSEDDELEDRTDAQIGRLLHQLDEGFDSVGSFRCREHVVRPQPGRGAKPPTHVVATQVRNAKCLGEVASNCGLSAARLARHQDE
jgi:hypothetical protein